MSEKFQAQSATALLALIGVNLEPTRASAAANTISAQVAGARPAFNALAFEAEPADYLKICAAETK